MRLPVKIFYAVLILFIASCGTRDQKVDRKNLIPPRDLVPLLTDLYMADGLLSYQPVRNIFNKKDSIINYMEVIEKHGYKKEQVDMTLKYYFMNNPKKLQKIYDQVLANLSEIQSELETKSPSLQDINLWNQKTSFGLPEDGVHNPLFFSIPVKDTGIYNLSFTCILFNDDQSLNPRTTVYFWHSDTTTQGLKDPWESVDLIKDGIRHNYSVSKRLTDTVFTHISGWLIESDMQPNRWEKHAMISNILLTKGLPE